MLAGATRLPITPRGLGHPAGSSAIVTCAARFFPAGVAMGLESTPITLFINQRYLTQPIQKIVDGWRVEPQHVIDKLIDHFREMGIFAVPYRHEQLVLRDMMYQLRHSPEIYRLVQKARQDELRKQRNRHAE
jgi:hypothetical protein